MMRINESPTGGDTFTASRLLVGWMWADLIERFERLARNGDVIMVANGAAKRKRGPKEERLVIKTDPSESAGEVAEKW